MSGTTSEVNVPAESKKNACFFIVLSTSIQPSDKGGTNQTNHDDPYFYWVSGSRWGKSRPGVIEDITPG
ncbi:MULTISPECIES: hypothetical protein [Pseudomonas]|uniref:hypothetical protein n=1 Tax=Pseudomonas TaxID=286 RepID=UPI00103C905B|nr:hypothetical protein [Pseudomonas sp. D1HM]